MPELICNTSPIQYLHQLGLLARLPVLADRVIVPAAVVEELATGRAVGIDLPESEAMEWMSVQSPSSSGVLPLVTDLGAGEKQVLALALERPGSVVVLDDLLARSFAEALSIPLTGTLGLLLDFKRVGVVEHVRSHLERLDRFGFRLDRRTRDSVLRLASE